MTRGEASIPRILLFCLFIILPLIHSAPVSSYLVSSFTSQDPTLPFNHITINNITGDVYIGARERLYQLNSDLTLKHTVNVGTCLDPGRGRINDNELLLVAPSPKNKLITCGGCDGYCETRNLTNISHDVVRHNSYSGQQIVSREDVPTVGAVVLGAEFAGNGDGTLDGAFYLFTGVSGNILPFISKHNLADLDRTHFIRISYNAPQNSFRNLIDYSDYLYYFMSRGENVYLGRLCRNSLDDNFESYTEIILQCGTHNLIKSAHIGPAGSQLADSWSNNSIDAILYAVFTSESSSALCVYKMSDVQQSFEDAVLGCIQGDFRKGTTNNYFRYSQCNSLSDDVMLPNSVQCSAYFEDEYIPFTLYRYASGTVPLSASPVITIPDVTATSIVTTIDRHHTIAFMGDVHGYLHKMNIVNVSFGYVYEDVFLGGGSVLQEMFLDECKEQLTLATSSEEGSKVLTMELANCGQYHGCTECIGENGGNDGDPYCGWCTLEARCTRYEECPFPDESTRWLSYNALQCVSITNVQPDHRLPYQETELEIMFTVQELPDLKDSYQYRCAFGSYVLIADTTGKTVTCVSPLANEVPTIPDGMDHVILTLSIVSTETDVGFVSTELILFECTYFKSCSLCVSSPWPCDWCVYDNRCTDDSSSCHLLDDTVIIGNNSLKGSGNKGQKFCPQLIGTSKTFFLPVGVASSYSLLANNLPTDQSKVQSFECILLINEVEMRAPSVFSNHSYILCSNEEYMYNENILEKNVSVSVQWNGQYNIDDPSDTYVTLYKCSVNSGSCSRCLSPDATPPTLNCGWCGNDCNVIQSDVCRKNQFLRQNETHLCSSPVITDFYPSSAPINGQTRLELYGTDLGVQFHDVLQIFIQDLECDLPDMDSFYQPGQRVSCVTGVSTKLTSGRIGITVRSSEGSKTGQSTEEFHYRDPMLTGFSPIEGQVAGGTEITIAGMYLDTGRNISARFGGAKCSGLIVQDTFATCITSSIPINERISVPLTMTFDGVEKTFAVFNFTYHPNPRINDIDRTESVMSGGLHIKLTGERFDLIQEPRIVVTSLTGDASNYELCNGTDTILICPTPSFPVDAIPTRKRRATNGVMTANLTFDLDGYIVDGGIIEYYPDPMYESFEGPEKIYHTSNGRLEVAGICLNLASMEDDVKVLLGPNGVCDVDDLEIDVVRCQLPEEQPLAGYMNGTLGQGAAKNLPAVTVLHGNLRFSPGFVSAWATDGNSFLATLIPVVIVVLILVIIPIIVLARWFRKKQLQVKRAKEEVEMVRTNILKRVREVANTSLDVSEADKRVQKQGVPFRGHVQYVTMMLFGGLGVHPETSDPEYMEDFMEHSVITFYRMLKKKDMLIDFIRQLEIKKQGHGRERELIASLLAITFVSEGKSIHFTDVLTSLVEDKIRTASQSRRGMDTLFTNTETIAAKLICNWFTLFMFDYLKVYAIYPMYMLYQAIKTQAEKGPIDVTTEEAYYTLEFNKLFDQEVEFRPLRLDVVDEDGQSYLRVTVLDVDTVKQVKQKILDSVWKRSYCLLPRNVDAVDLVWIQPPERATLLQDNEGTSETQGKTMVNTMKSYGIRNGSRIALVPKQQGDGYQTLDIHGDGYQALDLKDVSSNAYESFEQMTVEVIPEANPSKPGSKAIHLKGEEQLSQKGISMPDHVKQKKANIDRNLAIPHMLTMKASISPYVDGMFEVMFKKPAKIPLPVKHLFDMFDELAVRYGGVGSPQAYAETWKRNCLSNFWGSVLTNLPSFFEMPRSETADRCVVVLADALNHAASTISLRQEESDHLPYYKEHPLQRKMVNDYCTHIASQPKVRPVKVNRACSSVSKEFKGQLSHLSSLLHLYNLTKADVESLLK